jgi:hypothetical protein
MNQGAQSSGAIYFHPKANVLSLYANIDYENSYVLSLSIVALKT